MKLIDLTGQKFGRLTVVGQTFSKNGRTIWKCKCDCGNEKDIGGHDLKSRATRSCGCLQKEETASRFLTHGATETRLYFIWSTMKQRCENPSNEKSKRNYKDRGIAVCPEWHDFSVFQKWAFDNGYSDSLTIDRIDNDEGYCPENCRWADNKTQANNRRVCRYLTFNNETHTIAQWAEKLGMAYNVLDNRLLYLGWSVEKALTTPVRKRMPA
jgi:hypothetical protein